MGNTDGKHRSGGDSGSSDSLPVLESRVGTRGATIGSSERSHPTYEQLKRHTLSGHGHGHSPAPPSRPPKGIERSHSMLEKQKAPVLQDSRRLLPSVDAHATDTVKAHILNVEPKEGSVEVDVGSTVVVQFDGDVKTVNEDKIMEVMCTSVQPALPVRGKTIHNANTNRIEFIPHHSLLPKHAYEVQLFGRAITTVVCSNSSNISNHSWSFETRAPPSKSLKVKLAGEDEVIMCVVTDDMYYDLYKSLIEWGVRNFGISGEYIKDVFTSDANGFDMTIQADRDVLGITDDQILVFDVKD